MTAIAQFRARVAPRLPGCLDVLIDQAILDAGIEFCDKSLVIRRDAIVVSTIAGTGTYALEPNVGTTDTVVAFIFRAWSNEVELAPMSESDVQTPHGFQTFISGATKPRASPKGFSQSYMGGITLHPAPDGVYNINARVAVRPHRLAASFEDEVYEDWMEAIIDGALARLYMFPGTWSNPALAKFHSDKFDRAIASAQEEALRGNVAQNLRVTPVHI